MASTSNAALRHRCAIRPTSRPHIQTRQNHDSPSDVAAAECLERSRCSTHISTEKVLRQLISFVLFVPFVAKKPFVLFVAKTQLAIPLVLRVRATPAATSQRDC